MRRAREAPRASVCRPDISVVRPYACVCREQRRLVLGGAEALSPGRDADPPRGTRMNPPARLHESFTPGSQDGSRKKRRKEATDETRMGDRGVDPAGPGGDRD